MVLDGLRNARSDKDWWSDLSESQKQHIQEGIDDAENGRVISAAEFWDSLKNT
ncbi:MAG TPA: hypothetical protein VK625_10315 [Flavitalea sp.]|nr:hypothetical protein [Flavitalea sp.]